MIEKMRVQLEPGSHELFGIPVEVVQPLTLAFAVPAFSAEQLDFLDRLEAALEDIWEKYYEPELATN